MINLGRINEIQRVALWIFSTLKIENIPLKSGQLVCWMLDVLLVIAYELEDMY